MPAKAKPIDVKFVQECFRYDPESGDVFWSEDRPEEHFRTEGAYKAYMTGLAGRKAGWAGVNCAGAAKTQTIRHKYVRIKLPVGGKFYAHRIAYALMTGEDPADMFIDHINGNGLDNRWFNLRLATISDNGKNTWKHRAAKMDGGQMELAYE